MPKHVSKNAPKARLLSESEWRGLGVQQSRGWVHYAIHRRAPRRRSRRRNSAARRARAHSLIAVAPVARRPEPHILLFRRPQGTDPTTGLVHGKRIDPSTGKIVG